MRTPGGFSLIEVLVALTLLGIALLLGMDLVLQNPRVVRRLDGERQAFRAMESVMEAVRAGVIPLGCTDSQSPDPQCAELNRIASVFRESLPKYDLTLAMQVGPASPPGLYPVTLTAQYSAVSHKYTKKLQTMIWAPPHG